MDLDTYLRFLAALAFVLALIAGAGWLVRRTGLAGGALRAAGAGRRIGVVEIAAVDAKRRLVLVRRDGVEHLLLLGAGADLVLETGIVPPSPAGPAVEGEPGRFGRMLQAATGGKEPA